MQRTHPLAFVNGYHHRNDVKQNKMFINRTVLGPSMAWVDLLDVRVNDEGVYHCVLVDGTTITKTLTLYLKVRANYSAPVVTVTHSNKSVCGGSCLVTCSSSGGYPNTNVTWTFQPQTAGTQGMELSRISEQNNVTGLYTVSSSIFINCSQLLNITCTVGGVVSQQEEICNISANDSFDWVVITATAVTATMFTLVLVILVKRLKACPTTDPPDEETGIEGISPGTPLAGDR
ncbi:butyrophilin subfamily 1 member A1 isoform X2 [Conger conger]|nr:butyrophilin subfamily 1 member A1 isoform X2 [Conger conger]